MPGPDRSLDADLSAETAAEEGGFPDVPLKGGHLAPDRGRHLKLQQVKVNQRCSRWSEIHSHWQVRFGS